MPVVAATPQNIAHAARQLAAGRLVAFPTETVYGLGADARSGEAVARLFAAKGRPRFNPLIVHLESLDAAERYAQFDEPARRIAGELWPGPLTLVLPRRPGSGISDLVSAGLDTLAVRVPDHPIARALLRAAQMPIAAPSANRSGHVSPTRAEHVAQDFGENLLILDAGPTAHGLESTVVQIAGAGVLMLRPGAIPAEVIARVSGFPVERHTESDRPSSPGQLARHYAPRTPLRLEALDARPGEALLAFGPDLPAHDGPTLNLSPRGDLIEAAANLFAALRALDAAGARTIAVMPIPEHGLGEAINDRLRRAATE